MTRQMEKRLSRLEGKDGPDQFQRVLRVIVGPDQTLEDVLANQPEKVEPNSDDVLIIARMIVAPKPRTDAHEFH
jgi:hypothetical protein